MTLAASPFCRPLTVAVRVGSAAPYSLLLSTAVTVTVALFTITVTVFTTGSQPSAPEALIVTV